MSNEGKRPVVGYEGFYDVNELGEVFSRERWVTRIATYGAVQQFVPSKKRLCSKHGTGYLTVRLTDTTKVKTHRVHRLVAQAFIPNPDNKPFVNHKDSNRQNNHVDNLEWVTAKENTDHAVACGRLNVPKSSVNGQFIKVG